MLPDSDPVGKSLKLSPTAGIRPNSNVDCAKSSHVASMWTHVVDSVNLRKHHVTGRTGVLILVHKQIKKKKM